MIHMTLMQTAALLGLEPINLTGNFSGLSINTQTLSEGNLFIALPGARVDGHDFIDEAKRKGAAAALVTHPVVSSLPQLVVKDAVIAMGKLGEAWRNRFSIPFIAITGSNGKTTLKNMLASILKSACDNDESQVLATQGTLNNHLGLPLTLSRLNTQHRYAVIEMGMNHFGEIDYLTKLTRPNIVVITNAAAAHLEGVNDLAGVARAKAEIFAGLQSEGTGILNRDDPFFDYWYKQINHHNVLSFGFDLKADVTATLLDVTQTQPLIIHTPQGDIDIHLPLLGKHNVQNALAATAAAIAIHIPLRAIKSGLENILPATGRMQVHTLSNSSKIIDDTYNANPFSLQAATNTLAAQPGKKILVLGDMKELGTDTKTIHHEAGEKIRAAGIDYLFTYGDLSANTSQGFGKGAQHFTDQEKLVVALKPLLQDHTTILIKGSRSMHMENVVKALLHTIPEHDHHAH
jgi:UDP-N-acetylmuramoyl-tripeptide--D-alanyl-D-alanine ligase